MKLLLPVALASLAACQASEADRAIEAAEQAQISGSPAEQCRTARGAKESLERESRYDDAESWALYSDVYCAKAYLCTQVNDPTCI